MICSDRIKVDSGGALNVCLASSNRWVNKRAVNTAVGGAGTVSSLVGYYSNL